MRTDTLQQEIQVSITEWEDIKVWMPLAHMDVLKKQKF